MSSPVAVVRSRIAEVAVERARLTVVPRRRTRAARMPFVALVSLVLLGGVVGLLLFNTSMQQSSFAATALEGQATTLAARQQSLQMELEQLRNPQRIAGAAQRLGMVQAGNPAFLDLASGAIVGTPSPGDGSVPFRIWQLPPPKPPVINPPANVVEVEAPPAHAASGSGDTAASGAGNGARDGKKNHQTQQHQQHQQSQTQR
jgi:hypothetical protein